MVMSALRSSTFAISVFLAAASASLPAHAGQPLAALAAKTPLPVPADITSFGYNPDTGHLEFSSPSNFKDVTAFYREQLKPLGWTEDEPLTETENQETIKFSKGDDWVVLNITSSGTGTDFITEEPSLAGKGEKMTSVPAGGAAPAAPARQAAADVTPAPSAPSKVPLAMPDDAAEVAYDGDAGSLAFSSAMPIKVLVDFYRAEAKKKGWSETPSVINNEKMSVVTFTTGEDALGITIMALGDKTQVEAEGTFLEGKAAPNVAAASSDTSAQPSAAAPSPPKPGKVKIMFGNMSDEDAVITIAGKTIKIPAGADPKSSGDLALELAPGQLTASMKGAKENFRADADTSWIVGIGPGGLMVMQQ